MSDFDVDAELPVRTVRLSWPWRVRLLIRWARVRRWWMRLKLTPAERELCDRVDAAVDERFLFGESGQS